ncbi:GNAT family N-acetyltransferase [Lysinibacillus sp. SGAir0095]|uniref:GNAT family N-acetyltransferase n=1 Tax=Lysinibacillus sp. SGAir0095 TaxID=2070463 RepID=UPI0010CD59FF|nr:GNAT family N-acetyltransferase [Lysinibacillus sp. SGAir0095]QCR31236.1 N-acetyltransferase [Lysinibacillus sp. SGAir0095]
MKIHITTANVEDYEEVNSIVREGQDEHSEVLPHIFKKVDEAIPEAYFRELLEDPKSGFLIAKINEEIVGFAVMELKESPPFDTMTPRTYAYMNDFGVKSTHQRAGIGTDLFKACMEWSKNNGATSLELNVWEFNQKAISFYERFGMSSVSRKMQINI